MRSFILKDTNNSVEAAQLRNDTPLVHGFSWKQFLSRREGPVSEQLAGLLRERHCNRISRLGDRMDKNVFLKHLCSVMTTLEHFNGICRCLKGLEMLPSFLIYGEVKLVRQAIVDVQDCRSKYCVAKDCISDALVLSLKKDRHDRAVGILEAARERHAKGDGQCKLDGKVTNFGNILYIFFERLAPERDSTSLKRFLSLRGEEHGSTYPSIFGIFCQELVFHLRIWIEDSDSQQLLRELISQLYMLTPALFAKEFLIYCANDNGRINFVTYGWGEVIEEDLKEKYDYGGRGLWNWMMEKRYPGQFPSIYQPSMDILAAVLKKFKTKQELEGEWIEGSTPRFWVKLIKQLDLDFVPMVLLRIIAEYATVTWSGIPSRAQ